MDTAHQEFMHVREETGQRWAWDRVAEQLVRINPGQAVEFRERTRAGELVCPLEDCRTPSFTTVRMHRRRQTVVDDTFRHKDRPPVDHRPESIAHVQAKLLLADWLRTLGAAAVDAERRDTQARRTPDVSATLADGSRLAIEVQYSGLTAHIWRERDEGLREAGFSTVWLFGIRTAPGDAPLAHRGLQQVHRETLESKAGVWWLDVERVAIAASAVERTIGDAKFLTSLTADPGHAVTCLWAPFAAHRLEDGRLLSPHQTRLQDGDARWLAHLEAERERTHLEAETRALQEESEREAERLARAALPPPPSSPLTREYDPLEDVVVVVRNTSLRLRDALSFAHENDGSVHARPALWHAEVLHHFVIDRAYGNTFHFDDVRRFVARRQSCESGAGKAIWQFLEYLVVVGVLRGGVSARMKFGIGDEAPDPPQPGPRQPPLF